MNYRRVYLPGGTYFFTVVTFNRNPIFNLPGSIELLRYSFRSVMKKRPFEIVASCILPDHMHLIWTLPINDAQYSLRWGLIKRRFNQLLRNNSDNHNNSHLSSLKNIKIWQDRFWEHLIRDEDDLDRHIEYIHYNPVKHGLVKSPAEWPASSFLKYVKEGIYPLDWGFGITYWEGEQWMDL